jgi:ubiquinone/menaquinone biosynthesis C-methylase UbiE
MRLTIIFTLMCLTAFAQDPYKNIYSAHAWSERDKWQRADDLIKLLRIKPGDLAGDIGCHEGYMTFKLSKVVGPNGKIYAVDVEESKVKRVESLAAESKIQNIKAIKGDYDNPKLPLNLLDAVIILDTYHEMDDHDEILKHIFNALKPGGRLLICEPIAELRRKASRAEQESRHELGMTFALEDLKKAGFNISFQKDPYVDRVKEKGDKMWVVLAEK